MAAILSRPQCVKRIIFTCNLGTSCHTGLVVGIFISMSFRFVPVSPIVNKATIRPGDNLAPNNRTGAKLNECGPVHWQHSYVTGYWCIGVETNWPTFCRRHFKCIFFNENIWILMKISLNFVPKCHIDNKSALVRKCMQALNSTWKYLKQCWPSTMTHICVNGLNKLTLRPRQNVHPWDLVTIQMYSGMI